MLAARTAIFGKLELFRCIELTPLGYIILTPANGTHEPDIYTLFFFCHCYSIPQTPGVTQAAYSLRLYQQPFAQKAAFRDQSSEYDHRDL